EAASFLSPAAAAAPAPTTADHDRRTPVRVGIGVAVAVVRIRVGGIVIRRGRRARRGPRVVLHRGPVVIFRTDEAIGLRRIHRGNGDGRSHLEGQNALGVDARFVITGQQHTDNSGGSTGAGADSRSHT